MTEENAVEVRGLTKVFGEGDLRVEALRGVDLSIRRGEFVAVMGPSGSGKSTLLHLIGALDDATQGTIAVGGADLDSLDDDARAELRRRRIGFVFQAFNLIEVLTARENVALPLVIDGVPEAEAHRRAGVALEAVGLAPRAGHRPGEMSGGERQRTAVARALVTNPVLVLADEPTGNLDSVAGDRIMRLLRRLADEHGHTILAVTHDPRYAAVADRILHFRDGRVVDEQVSPPARDARSLLGEMDEAP